MNAKQLQPHEFAAVFPPMPEGEVRQLAEDIRQNGLHEPIMLFEGKILDGRHRQQACEIAGEPPEYEEFEGTRDQALAYVWSQNIHRRHLTVSQRAMAAASVANLGEGQPSRTPQTCGVSQEAAAQQAGVSTRSVTSAKRVMTEGTEHDIEAVRSGEKSVNGALRDIDRRKHKASEPEPQSPADPREALTAAMKAFNSEVESWCRELKALVPRLPASHLLAGTYVAEITDDARIMAKIARARKGAELCSCLGADADCDYCAGGGFLDKGAAERQAGMERLRGDAAS